MFISVNILFAVIEEVIHSSNYHYINSISLFIRNLNNSITEKKLPPGFPVITSPPASKAVEVGHNAVLHCTVTGDPPPTIMWIRDFLPLDINSNERYSILDSGLPGNEQKISHNEVHD